jgi:hypothetical protein
VTSIEDDFYGGVVGESFLQVRIEVGVTPRQDEQMTGHLSTSMNKADIRSAHLAYSVPEL